MSNNVLLCRNHPSYLSECLFRIQRLPWQSLDLSQYEYCMIHCSFGKICYPLNITLHDIHHSKYNRTYSFRASSLVFKDMSLIAEVIHYAAMLAVFVTHRELVQMLGNVCQVLFTAASIDDKVYFVVFDLHCIPVYDDDRNMSLFLSMGLCTFLQANAWISHNFDPKEFVDKRKSELDFSLSCYAPQRMSASL